MTFFLECDVVYFVIGYLKKKKLEPFETSRSAEQTTQNDIKECNLQQHEWNNFEHAKAIRGKFLQNVPIYSRPIFAQCKINPYFKMVITGRIISVFIESVTTKKSLNFSSNALCNLSIPNFVEISLSVLAETRSDKWP